jgi:hypothetical protein
VSPQRASDLAKSSGNPPDRTALVEMLSEVPARVPSIYLIESGSTSLSINWVEPMKKKHQVPSL